MDSAAIWSYIENFSGSLARALPDTLYHYAGASDALLALQRGELWASALPYLRDPTEPKRSLGVALHLVQQRLSELRVPKSWDEQVQIKLASTASLRQTLFEVYLLERVETHLKAHLSTGRLSCALSLSARSDSEWQWQRYCPGGGYALGFTSEHLSTLAAAQDFSLYPCYYGSWEEHDEIIQGAILGSMQAWVPQVDIIYRSANLGKKRNREAAWKKAQRIISSEAEKVSAVVLQVAALLRNVQHEDEAEWRLITDELSSNEVDYREVRGMIAPFKRFGLTHESYDYALPLERVVVGTRGERELALHGLQGLLNKVHISAPQHPVLLQTSTWDAAA